MAADATTTWSINAQIPATPTNVQWISPSGTSGNSAEDGTINPCTTISTKFLFDILSSDTSTPTSIVQLSGTQSGNINFKFDLTKTAQTVWLDAGTGWSVNTPITAASNTERWNVSIGSFRIHYRCHQH